MDLFMLLPQYPDQYHSTAATASIDVMLTVFQGILRILTGGIPQGSAFLRFSFQPAVLHVLLLDIRLKRMYNECVTEYYVRNYYIFSMIRLQ